MLSRRLIILNGMILLSFFAALFFLLTNGIPLIQLGWMKPLSSKTRYVNTMRISVSVFALIMAIVYFRFRDVFHRLWLVKTAPFLASRHLTVIAGLFIFYFLITYAVCWERHLALETRAFDLGIFAQAVWNTSKGDFLFSSIKGNICLLGDHVSPLLALIAPIYAVWPDPRFLLMLQCLSTAACIVMIAKIALMKTQSKGVSLIFCLLFIFYLPARNALHEDFHPEVLVDLFSLLAFYFLDRGKRVLFLLSLLVVVIAKENMMGIAFVLGIYACFVKRFYRLGFFVAVASIALFLAETMWMVPHFSKDAYLYRGAYDRWIQEPFSMLLEVIKDGERWEYIAKVYSPFLFLNFFHFPTLLLTAPILVQNLISENEVMRSFAYHYMAGLWPFLFISAIYGFHRASTGIRFINRHKHLAVALLLFVSVLRSGPSEYYYWWQSHQHRSNHRDQIRQVLANISSDAIVLTHNNLIPQMINRKYVYQFNYNPIPTKKQQAQDYQADYVILEKEFMEPNTLSWQETIAELKQIGYGIEWSSEGFAVLVKDSAEGV